MKRVGHWVTLVLVGVLAGALALGAVACDDDDDNGNGAEPTATEAMDEEPTEPAGAEIPSVEITGVDFAFEAPASIEGGVTEIVFTNAAEMEDHQAQLLKLNEGVTMEDLAGVEDEAGLLALVTPVGGPGTAAGGTSSNVLDLDPGNYAIVCLIPSPDDGIPHVQKGMVAPLEVTEPMVEAEVPAADVSVGLSDFAFDAPASLPAGETVIDAVNNGPQPHELALLRIQDGSTYDEALDIILTPPGEGPPPEGPPPFSFTGQVAVLGDGLSGQTTLDLTAGAYALLCFVTDPDSGLPHAALGMAQELTVE